MRPGAGRRSAGKAEDEFPTFTEKWSYGSGDVKTVRIAVEGPIFRESEESFFGFKYDKIEAILRQIRAAKNDEAVKAIILEVDSPGGDLTASDEIYKALQDFKRCAEGRKIIVFVRNMAASGGYYVSAPADWIIAEPTSIIGSIGVIMQTLNWKGLSEKIGLTDVTIKSGTNKDLLNPFRDVSPDAGRATAGNDRRDVPAVLRRSFRPTGTSRWRASRRLPTAGSFPPTWRSKTG